MLKEEFTKSVLIHREKMIRFAWSYLKDLDDARDIVQDVFLGLWEKKDSLRNIENTEAWCMTLVRNKSLDKLKKIETRMKSSITESSLNGKAHTGISPLEKLANKQVVADVQKIINELPEDQASSFNLRDMQGYSYLEISEILGISLSSVKVNIFRARKYLKKQLEGSYRYGTEEI